MLTVVIITKNEEEKISKCIKGVGFTDEVVIIDTGSSDKTVKIAKESGARVFEYKKGSFQDWRNKGIEKSKGDWVLYVDADEIVDEELKKEIEGIIKKGKKNKKYTHWAIPRKNIILGKHLKHGGWWPDYVKRFFIKENLIKWENDLHEQPLVRGKMGYLSNPLIHLKHDNLSEMMEKTNDWSEIEAKLMFEDNHPSMNIARFLSAMLREFWLRMIKNKAFMDGSTGIIYAIYQVWSRFLSYAKLWEMQYKKVKKA